MRAFLPDRLAKSMESAMLWWAGLSSGPGMGVARLHLGLRTGKGEAVEGNCCVLAGRGNDLGECSSAWGFPPLAKFPAGRLWKSSCPPALQGEASSPERSRDCHLDTDRLLVARGPAWLPPTSSGLRVPLVRPFSPPQGHGQGGDGGHQVGDTRCDL